MHVVRALVAQILTAAGFVAIEAETVDDALAVVRADPPEVAIVDEHLAGDLAALPVPWIALGQGHPHALRAPAPGACCVIAKPFLPDDVVRAVSWALRVHGGAAPRA